ncbi:MAG: hypothetical protein HY744_26195 [Deltaproteobacteria bacterium]|nr:hypothetical protein [Deltaproteobacteria bacterium]
MEDPLEAARAALSGNEPEHVAELWREADARALDPGRRFEWLLLLLEAGDAATASAAAGALAGTEWEARAAALLEAGEADDTPAGAEPAEDDVEVDEVLRLAAPDTDAALVERFLRWFGGRKDLHARQWYDERRRRSGYRLVEEPLTAEVARLHLAGRLTLGQYLLFPDGSCAFGVVDLDLSASALAELRATRGDAVRPVEHGPLRDYALRLVEAARRLGLGLFAEDSGGRGLHLWLFFEPRRPARAVRALLGQLVVAAGSQPPDVAVEIFPKQDRPGPKGLSSLVKLPLGIHQATLRRCALLDEKLDPVEDPWAALDRLRAAAPDVVDDVLGRRLVIMPTPCRCPSCPPCRAPAVWRRRCAPSSPAGPSGRRARPCSRAAPCSGAWSRSPTPNGVWIRPRPAPWSTRWVSSGPPARSPTRSSTRPGRHARSSAGREPACPRPPGARGCAGLPWPGPPTARAPS